MNRNGTIRRGIILTLVAAILISCCGSAGAEILLTQDTDAILPDGVHRMTLPAGMISLTPGTDEPDLKGIFQREPDLEMLVYAYDAQGATIEGTAEKLRNAGRDAAYTPTTRRAPPSRERRNSCGTPGGTPSSAGSGMKSSSLSETGTTPTTPPASDTRTFTKDG